MKFTSKRLILRPATMRDVKDIVEGIGNLKVSRYTLVVPYPYTAKDGRWFINQCRKKARQRHRTSYEFSIELKSEKKVIGGVGLSDVDRWHGTADVGYWLAEPYWKQGYGTEAATEVLDFAFDKLKVRKIRIPVFTVNKGSNALARKLGARLEGTLRKHARPKATGKIHDENIYGLFKGEWEKARKRLR